MTNLNMKQITLNYTVVNEGVRPVILYLHGFTGSHADWSEIIKRLGQGFCHVAVDLPGHGSSLKLSAYDMPETVVALIDLLNKLGIAETNLVGYSMGGRLGFLMALNYPQYFKNVALESTSPGLKTDAEKILRLEQDEIIAGRLSQEPLEMFLKNWYRQPIFNGLQEHPQFNTLINRRLHNNPFELMQALRGLSVARQPSLWERLNEIQKPVLLLCGGRDEKYMQISAEMAQVNPFFRRVVLPNCSHNAHFEQKEAFVRELKSFFEKT